MAYTLATLKSQLDELPPDGQLSITYETFADLFPPGEPDVNARRGLGVFAHSAGCDLKNDQHNQIIDFTKRKQASA